MSFSSILTSRRVLTVPVIVIVPICKCPLSFQYVLQLEQEEEEEEDKFDVFVSVKDPEKIGDVYYVCSLFNKY